MTVAYPPLAAPAPEDVPPRMAASDRSGWRVAWWVAAVVILLLQTTLVIVHQPWVDEWQALEIALQSPSLWALADNLHYEGHPPLWYWLLRAFGTVVPPLWVLVAVQLPIALAIQALILFRSPFRPLERLLLATNAFVLFEWGTIARDLSAGVLLTLCAVAAKSRRAAWIAIALLPLLGIQFGWLSIALIVLMRVDGRWWLGGALLWGACGLIAAVSVIPAADIVAAVPIQPFPMNIVLIPYRIAPLLIPIQMSDHHLQWNGSLPYPLWLPAGLAFIGLSLREASTRRLHRTIYAVTLATTCLFAGFVYPLQMRHFSLLILLLIVLKWREANDGQALRFGARLWLGVASACGLFAAVIGLTIPFDTAASAAAAIRARGLEHEHWVAWPASHGSGVAALLGREFETPTNGCTQSFMRWNMPFAFELPPLHGQLERIARRDGRFYLLTSLSLPADFDARPIAEIPAGYDGAEYRLYLYAPERPASGRMPVPCAPARRPL